MSYDAMPANHRAGISFELTLNIDDDYPIADHDINLHLRGPSTIDIAGTDEGGGDVKFSDLPASWNAGEYTYQLLATRTEDSAKFQLDIGKIKILPEVAAITEGVDQRSHIQKMVDELEALIEVRINSGGLKSNEFQAETAQKYENEPLETLFKLRSSYRRQLDAIKRAEKGLSTAYAVCGVSLS